MARRVFARQVLYSNQEHTIEVHTQLTVISACHHIGDKMYLITNENDTSPLTTMEVRVIEPGDEVPSETNRTVAAVVLMPDDDIKVVCISKNTDN